VLNCVPDVKDIGNVVPARRRSVIRAKRYRPWNALALRYREDGRRSHHPEPESRKTKSLFVCWARMSREKSTVRQREKRTRCHVENADKSPKEIICGEISACT